MRVAHLVLAVVGLASCGGSDTTDPAGVPKRGIQFVSGTDITDSADAILAQPLVVEVHDSTGRLAPLGVLVRFCGVQRSDVVDFEAQLQSPTSQQFLPFVTGSTDASGRVIVRVRLGSRAGPARVAVFAPTLGVSDTARYTIVPGAAARIVLAPTDTTIYVGRSYALRGGVTDLNGNARSDPIAWSVSRMGVAVAGAGIVSASLVGYYTIVARLSSEYALGINVSVVPQARIVGVLGGRVVAVDIDGANQRELIPPLVPGVGAQPRWVPGTSTVVYSHLEGQIHVLYVADESGGFKRFLAPTPTTVSHQAEPAPTWNGQWLYFSAYDSPCSSVHYCLYRSRIDGTAAELLGDVIDSATTTPQPSPSPDGSQVAFITSSNGTPVIKVYNVALRTISSWGVPGQYPAWSTGGTQIAFVPNGGGRLMLMNADGSGVRQLTSFAIGADPVSWSPDGRWIIARWELGILLVDPDSGEYITVRLPRGGLAAPSIR